MDEGSTRLFGRIPVGGDTDPAAGPAATCPSQPAWHEYQLHDSGYHSPRGQNLPKGRDCSECLSQGKLTESGTLLGCPASVAVANCSPQGCTERGLSLFLFLFCLSFRLLLRLLLAG